MPKSRSKAAKPKVMGRGRVGKSESLNNWSDDDDLPLIKYKKKPIEQTDSDCSSDGDNLPLITITNKKQREILHRKTLENSDQTIFSGQTGDSESMSSNFNEQTGNVENISSNFSAYGFEDILDILEINSDLETINVHDILQLDSDYLEEPYHQENINVPSSADNIAQLNMHSDLYSGVSLPAWVKPPAPLNPTDEEAIIDILPPVLLMEGNPDPTEITFKLVRGAKNRRTGGTGDQIIEIPTGYRYRQCIKQKKVQNKKVIGYTGQFWKCVNHERHNFHCKARLLTPLDYDNPDLPEESVILDVTRSNNEIKHVCTPDPALYFVQKVRINVKNLAVAPAYRFADPKVVIAAAREMAKVPIDIPSESFPSHKNFSDMIRRARGIEKPELPTKENVLYFTLTEGLIPTDFFRSSTLTVNTDKNGQTYSSRSLLFVNRKQLHILTQVKHIKVDGTFKILQKPFYQLVVVHGMVNAGVNEGSKPLAYIIMTGKTEVDYTASFNELKMLIKNTSGQDCQIKTAMCDFELALRNSLKRVFDGIELSGCWFHYCQAIYRRVGKLKLINAFRHQDSPRQVIKLLMNLVLMDAKSIEPLFEYIKELAAKFQDRRMDALLKYTEKQWVKNKNIPLTELSLYGSQIRTNNEAENFNGKMWNRAGMKKLNIYVLLMHLNLLADECLDDLKQPDAKTKKKQSKSC